MDKVKQLKDALSRLQRMDYSTPPEKLYEQINNVVLGIETVARKAAAELVQQVLDALKPKTVETKADKVETVENPSAEEPKNEQSA